jgi:hypothetical protein
VVSEGDDSILKFVEAGLTSSYSVDQTKLTLTLIQTKTPLKKNAEKHPI